MKKIIVTTGLLIGVLIIALASTGCRNTVLDKYIYVNGALTDHVHVGQTVVLGWTDYGNLNLTNEPNKFEASAYKVHVGVDANAVEAVTKGAVEGALILK